MIRDKQRQWPVRAAPNRAIARVLAADVFVEVGFVERGLLVGQRNALLFQFGGLTRAAAHVVHFALWDSHRVR